MGWAKRLRNLLKHRTIPRLDGLNPQRALQPASLQRLFPTGRIVTQICAAPSAFAGRVNRYTAVGIAHQAEQPTLYIGAPTRNTHTHWNMFWPWPGYFFLRLRHITELFFVHRFITRLRLVLVEHIGSDQPLATIDVELLEGRS